MRYLMRLMAIPVLWIGLWYFLVYWEEHYREPAVVSSKWNHQVVVVEQVCFIGPDLVMTDEIAQWCIANGGHDTYMQ